MTEPKFSVILPVFRGGGYFRDCVRSILAQDIREFELTILDNYSSSEDQQWISTLRDPRIVHLRSDRPLSMEENWARIRDINKREYMTIVCHDDLLQPNFLAEISRLIKKHPDASLYQTHFTLIDGHGCEVRGSTPIPEIEKCEDFLRSRLQFERDSFGSAYVFRSADYGEGIPPYKNLLYADDALWLELMSKSYKAASEESCFEFRMHRDSVASKVSVEDHLSALGDYLSFLAVLSEREPKVKEVMGEKLPAYVMTRLKRLVCVSIRSANLLGVRIDETELAAVDKFYGSVLKTDSPPPGHSAIVSLYRFVNALPARTPVQKILSSLDANLKKITGKPVSTA